MSCEISTDKNRLDLQKIHSYISDTSYWGRDRSMEEVMSTIAHSLCFGMYNKEGVQMGFGRVVTDYTVFAYLMDIIIFEPFQRKGFGRVLMQYIMDHEAVKKARTIALKTKDAHSFYESFGFKKVGDSALWMSKDSVVLL